jgi:hypothetical protein
VAPRGCLDLELLAERLGEPGRQQVEFDITQGQKGPQAENVKVIS